MSYIRPRQSLSGVTTAPGPQYAPRGLSGVTTAPGPQYAPRGLAGLFDAPEPLPVLPPPKNEDEWRSQMLVYQRALATKANVWVQQDKQIRYLQIAATLSIPVAGMVWNWILRRRSSAAGTE